MEESIGVTFSLERGAQVGDWDVVGWRRSTSVVSNCQQAARLHSEQDLRISIDLVFGAVLKQLPSCIANDRQFEKGKVCSCTADADQRHRIVQVLQSTNLCILCLINIAPNLWFDWTFPTAVSGDRAGSEDKLRKRYNIEDILWQRRKSWQSHTQRFISETRSHEGDTVRHAIYSCFTRRRGESHVGEGVALRCRCEGAEILRFGV